jgi:hypothetical protein
LQELAQTAEIADLLGIPEKTEYLATGLPAPAFIGN